ncbi:MAG: amidohydrolase family protein, partial [Caulobacterales bacterium]
LRAVAYLYGRSVDELMGVTKDLISRGIRAFTVSPTTLLGGVSPAHSDLTPFYALLEQNNIPLTLHVLGDQGFLGTRAWGDAPFFKGYSVFHEFDFSPWALSVVHLPPQNFIATMVTGGVFERHPNLRFGAIELGSYWIGQLAHNLDLWHRQNNSLFKKIELKAEGNAQDQVQSALAVERLPKFPSFYINRNVRVSAYDFEHVDEYIERYGIEDVYCYSSDFPHVEGGRDPMGAHAARLEKLGPDILEKFFVTNGAWLLPD